MGRQAFATIIVLSTLCGAASAQIAVTSVGGPPFNEAWVDPCNGNDAIAVFTPTCQSTPFRTIQAAINALDNISSAANPGLVHCDAGIYSATTNGEVFPIVMKDWVNLQGVGARQCVIRGEGYYSSNVFYPENVHGCNCGSLTSAEVLVDLSQLYNGPDEEMIDGFTFQGGDVQVYFRGEAEVYARISNCVFDMLSGDKTVLMSLPDDPATVIPNPLNGPTFGILIVHDFHPNYLPWQYYATPINVLNNTFVMGWQITDDEVLASQPDAVAICDVNNPLCYLPTGQSDPNTTLRGIGPLNIQNNLIRTLPNQLGMAMLGVDETATMVQFGTPTGASNAFDPRRVGGTDLTGRFCSKFNTLHGNGRPPKARVNINPTVAGGRDAAFIGEMLTRNFAQPTSVSRDWRLLPSSPLVDAGAVPLPLAAGGILRARNGTAYTEPMDVPLSSFDLDGEVYGNPRVQPAFGSNVPRVDIGFDETHLMVDCGGWANDSVSHRWDPNVTKELCGPLNQGQPLRGLIFPVAGAYVLFETRISIPMPILLNCSPNAFYTAYTTMWGTAVPPATVAGFPAFFDLNWMLPATLGPGGTASIVSYTAPNDPTIHTFGAGIAPTVGATPWQFVNEQSLFAPTGSGTNFISNLQSSTD